MSQMNIGHSEEEEPLGDLDYLGPRWRGPGPEQQIDDAQDANSSEEDNQVDPSNGNAEEGAAVEDNLEEEQIEEIVEVPEAAVEVEVVAEVMDPEEQAPEAAPIDWDDLGIPIEVQEAMARVAARYPGVRFFVEDIPMNSQEQDLDAPILVPAADQMMPVPQHPDPEINEFEDERMEDMAEVVDAASAIGAEQEEAAGVENNVFFDGMVMNQMMPALLSPEVEETKEELLKIAEEGTVASNQDALMDVEEIVGAEHQEEPNDIVNARREQVIAPAAVLMPGAEIDAQNNQVPALAPADIPAANLNAPNEDALMEVGNVVASLDPQVDPPADQDEIAFLQVIPALPLMSAPVDRQEDPAEDEDIMIVEQVQVPDLQPVQQIPGAEEEEEPEADEDIVVVAQIHQAPNAQVLAPVQVPMGAPAAAPAPMPVVVDAPMEIEEDEMPEDPEEPEDDEDDNFVFPMIPIPPHLPAPVPQPAPVPAPVPARTPARRPYARNSRAIGAARQRELDTSLIVKSYARQSKNQPLRRSVRIRENGPIGTGRSRRA